MAVLVCIPTNSVRGFPFLEKTLESPSDSKEIKPVNPKGNQPWLSIGMTDAEAEVSVLWPPNAKNWLIGKDPDTGKDWRQEEKGATEEEMVGWHHRLNEHEFEQTLGDSEGQGMVACCSPWGCRESDMTEWQNNSSNPCPSHRWRCPTITSSLRPSPPAFSLSQHLGFSNELALPIRWPKNWSFSFSISPSNEYSGLISCRMDWFDLLADQWTLKSCLLYHHLKASVFWCSAFFVVQPQLTFVYDYGKNHSFERETNIWWIQIWWKLPIATKTLNEPQIEEIWRKPH